MSLDLLDTTRERIRATLPERDQRARAHVVEILARRALAVTDGLVETTPSLVIALIRSAVEARSSYLELERSKQELAANCAAATSPERLKAVILDFIDARATPGVDIVKDRVAVDRWLDRDALFDRLGVQLADAVDEIEVAYAAARELVGAVTGREVIALQAETLLGLAYEMLETSGPEILRVAPLQFVRALLRCFDPAERFMVLGLARHRRTRELARTGYLDCWSRIAAFEILKVAAPDDALPIMASALVDHTGRDGMVVRNNLLRMLGDLDTKPAEKVRLLWRAHEDPSEHVRQGLARELGKLTTRGSAARMVELATRDPSPRVRGFTTRELSRRALHDFNGARALLDLFSQVAPRLATEPEKLAKIELRVLLHEMRLHVSEPGGILSPHDAVSLLQPVLSAGTLSLEFLEEAAVVLIWAEVYSSQHLSTLRALLHDEFKNLAEGQEREIQLLPGVTLRNLERALLVAARGGLPATVDHLGSGSCRLGKGERRGLMAWRVLHELRNPAPDKREAFPHTTGRSGREQIVVPPFQMGEVTPTRVPGERRQIDAIRCWGVFLPLVDEFVSALRSPGRTRRLVTAFGTVVITVPRALGARLWARFELTWRYVYYARLREVSLGAGTEKERRQFSKAMTDLGFGLTWEHRQGSIRESAVSGRPTSGRPKSHRTAADVVVTQDAAYSLATPAVDRYFAFAFALMPTTPSWIDAIVNEALRPTGNTAWHLAIVVWTLLSYMIIKGAWIRASTERSRRQIPITVGGWGSRGKSGSERIKAALFHALRYDTLVKTTGCEAMFIHARRDLPARELYVYRPYGKATIWEQGKLLRYADKLNAQVFLWECMALRPQFVRLLEHEWLKDEVTTLTNAYPDHEDVMGPSGEDVARVIGTFGAKKGTIFTAEQELLPILEEIARTHESPLHSTTEIDAELLPIDMLARFPYAEHPRNVALILAVARHFGVDWEWALVKMADHAVPDLGVLKTYPTVHYLRRRLTFSNGMSANERAGFMSNWRRLEYDRIDLDKDFESVTVAVVNNRADRVPRSRVFADLLTHDVACDVVCVIGSNIGGMGQFIEEGLDDWLSTLGLGDGTPGLAESQLEVHCVRIRVLRKLETVKNRVRLVLRAAGLDEDETEAGITSLFAEDPAGRELAALEPSLGALRPTIEAKDRTGLEGTVEPEVFLDSIRTIVGLYLESSNQLKKIREQLAADDRGGAERTLRAWFRAVYMARVILVWDFHTTGDQIIALLARRVAPGHHGRVLGCQNIKGTGLDFAYRWVSIGQVDTALTRLETDPTGRTEAIGWLMGHTDWGLMDVLDAVRRLTVIRESTDPAWAPLKGPLDSLWGMLQQKLAEKLNRLGKAPKQTWWQKALNKVEPLVDHLDAIRRQKTATRIMNELFAMRVSQGHAALMLREVTDRGHGGWLAEDVGHWLHRQKARFRRQPKSDAAS